LSSPDKNKNKKESRKWLRGPIIIIKGLGGVVAAGVAAGALGAVW
jgi:hypothetical protein